MPGAHDRRLDLDDEYVYLLIEACGAANTALETYAKHHAKQDENLATTLASIRALVEGIATAAQANPATVSLVHLEQITEAAWLLVVDSLAGSAYPGWTSLLLRLVLSDDNNTDFVRPRWLDMQTLSNAVHDIVNPMSKVSWEFGNIRERQANRDLYDSVAQTLWAQNEVRETIRSQPKLPQSVLPARPVAYVSSFDYELEMALWRTAAEYKHARSFSVVFPAYAVTEGDPHLGTFVWLEAVVEASASASDSVGHRDLSDFETMRTVKKFRLLDSATDVSSYEDHPIVVRIVGCPLLKLPESIDKDLADDLEDAQLPDVAGFVHAVTVDEYLALRQTERDWVWSFTESHRGLPNKYFDSGRSAPRKYWMVLGVPFRDPAIRLRVMSVLARNDGGKAKSPEEPKGKNNKAPVVPADQAATDSVAPLSGAKYPSLLSAPTSKVLDSSPSAPEEPRHGVAINTRTDDEEIMLLNSLGFPVIRGTCESFTEDLKAHAAELAKAAAKYAPKEDQS
jgi:hypothetical protein